MNSYVQKSSMNSLQSSSPEPMNSHNMASMMQRSNNLMGFDQTKISREFSSTEDGGQIKITALDENDNKTINQIRNHIIDIQNDFAEGNFTKPFYIHSQ